MSLVTFMIGSTFVLGVLLALFGCFAIVRGLAKGSGGTVTLLGNTITAKTGATLIFLVGVTFVGSGFGWASTQEVAEKRGHELKKADDALGKVEEERTQLRASLKTSVSAEKYQELEQKTPWLKAGQTWRPSTELMRDVGARRIGG
jgi:hypothetical protein